MTFRDNSDVPTVDFAGIIFATVIFLVEMKTGIVIERRWGPTRGPKERISEDYNKATK